MANIDIWNWDSSIMVEVNDEAELYSIEVADGSAAIHFDTRQGIVDLRDRLNLALENGAKV